MKREIAIGVGFRVEFTWGGRGLSKSLISRVIIGVTPSRVLITLLITYLLSPLPLQVGAIGLWAGRSYGLFRSGHPLQKMLPAEPPVWGGSARG